MVGMTMQLPLLEATTIRVYAQKNGLSRSSVQRMALLRFIEVNKEISNIMTELSKLSNEKLVEINVKLNNKE